MFWLNTAMMRSLNPSFQVAENEMDHGQVRLSLVRVSAERQRLMAVSRLGKSGIAGPSIRTQDRAKRYVLFDKAGKLCGAPVGYDAKPQPSRIDAASLFFAVILTGSNLDSADNDRLVMSSATFAARLAADHAFVDLDGMLTANGIAFGANHASTELMEYLKGCLITAERELALELDGGLSGDLRGHEVCAPKPCREGRVARLHHSAGRQRRIDLAVTAAKHDRRPRCETVRLADNAALRARKPARPTDGFEIARASCVIREDSLKLRKRSGETANVHTRDNGRFPFLCQETG